MTWFALSILSVFALAIAELMQQHLLNIKNAFTPRVSVILTFLFQSLLVIPFIFIFGITDQFFSIFNLEIFPKFFLVTFLSSLASLFYLKSFRVKNISISLIFVSFSAIVSTFLGIIFFSESTSLLKFLGIGFILVGIFIIYYKKIVSEKNNLFGLLAGLIFGINYTIDKSIILSDIHPLIYMFWLFLAISIWNLLFNWKENKTFSKDKSFINYKPIIISGLGYFLFNLFTFSAYKFGGEVGRIDAINNSQIFLIILFEFFILKNTKGTARKLFSAGLAILGIFILGFVR